MKEKRQVSVKVLSDLRFLMIMENPVKLRSVLPSHPLDEKPKLVFAIYIAMSRSANGIL